MTTTNAGCEGCKYLMRQDEGYSNYTDMSTSLDCLKGVHPALPLSDADIEGPALEAALSFGETCPARVAGDGPWFDVEGDVTDEQYKDDVEIYALLFKRRNDG